MSEAGRQGRDDRGFRLRSHRLGTKDFAGVYREGSRARGSLMTVVVRETDREVQRFGLSVGKRCSKRAVARNRVRRVFREAFRLARAEFPDGVDVVMIASTPGIVPDLDETRRELRAMFKKALRRYREKLAERSSSASPNRGAR